MNGRVEATVMALVVASDYEVFRRGDVVERCGSGVSEMTVWRALSDLVELGVLEKKSKTKYRVASEYVSGGDV